MAYTKTPPEDEELELEEELELLDEELELLEEELLLDEELELLDDEELEDDELEDELLPTMPEEELDELDELELDEELDELELLEEPGSVPGSMPPQAAIADDNKDTVRILRIDYLHFSLSEM